MFDGGRLNDLMYLLDARSTHASNQINCVQPRASAVNTALPASAAERRAAAPLLLGAGARCCRSIRKRRKIHLLHMPAAVRTCLQCFDAVGWAAGRASGL